MEKLMIKALELAGYNNAQDIVRIANSTPNPVAAIEIVLGIHKPTAIEDYGQFWKDRSNSVYKITEVDDLTNMVFYEKSKQKTVNMYFKTEEDYNNLNGSLERMSDYYSSKAIAVEGIVTVADSKSISSDKSGYYNEWIKITEQEYNEFLESWSSPKTVETEQPALM